MRAAIVPEPGRIELVEIPEPKYGDYEALVQILSCSICSGTDSHIVSGQFPWHAYPCVLGHESIGRVLEVGSGVRNLRPGDLVLRPTAVRPGETLGGYNSMFGSFAEIGIVADAAAIVADTPSRETPKLPPFATAQQVVPADFDPDLAGALITFKETLSFLQRLGVQVGKSVLILGSGTVGLSFAFGAKLMGAGPVIITGRRAEPLAAARGWGADYAVNVNEENVADAVRRYTSGRGADFVVEAIGDWGALQDGIRAAADYGQVGVYGVAPGHAATLDWSGTPANWALRFVQPKEEEVHQLVLDQVRLGWVDLQRFVTHRLPFDAIREGFDLVTSKKATKVAIRIQ